MATTRPRTARVLPVCVLLSAMVLIGACTPSPPAGGGGPVDPDPDPAGPEIDIEVRVFNQEAPAVVSFGGLIVDAPEEISVWSWDFGNGTSWLGRYPPLVTYPVGGTFEVLLVAEDVTGAIATATTTVTVTGDSDGDGVYAPTDCDDGDASVYPGAPDPPGDGVDTDCDYIDGIPAQSVFVRSDGSDSGDCGSMAGPCATIEAAQARAAVLGRSAVLVAGGTYPGFHLQPGIEVWGGYAQNWQYDFYGVGDRDVVIDGASLVPGLQGPATVVADGISLPTVLGQMTVRGAVADPGKPSYGLVVRDSTEALVLESLTVLGGTGGDGSAGQDGTGPTEMERAADGEHGEDSRLLAGCDATTRNQGGAGGTSAAGVAGSGGDSGTADTNCGDFDRDAAATSGIGGTSAVPGGAGGTAGVYYTFICSGSADGKPGAPGVVGSDGDGGDGGTASLGVTSGSGDPGTATGTAGTSGGGGGGGAGCDNVGPDSIGGGGGGGGAGGLPADRAGSGGTAGARSVAVLLDNSTPTVLSSSIVVGIGGAGGSGGNRGFGQAGGLAGSGGDGAVGTSGGSGGAGGSGGLAGAGGGGAGGAAIGLGLVAGSTPVGSFSTSGGAGGAGGPGGPGGPNGPAGEDGQIGVVIGEVEL